MTDEQGTANRDHEGATTTDADGDRLHEAIALAYQKSDPMV